MTPTRMGGLAYWASGGSVTGRQGPLALARAFELLAFFNREAEACASRGEVPAAQFCAELALELGFAIARAAAWRRCAAA